MFLKKALYTLLEETWQKFECAQQTYEDFRAGVLAALNLTEDKSGNTSFRDN